MLAIVSCQGDQPRGLVLLSLSPEPANVEEMLAAGGIEVSHETVRRWAEKFGRGYANRIRRSAPRSADRWHLDEVVISIAGMRHWLWRAIDQDGFVLDARVQSRRNRKAAKRLFASR